MIFADINPFVRYARNEYISTQRNNITYCAYDNRIFICTDGEGEITVNKNVYHIIPGTLLMWRGGNKYTYNTSSYMILAGCNFDFTCNKMYDDIAIPPVVSRSLKKEELEESAHFEDASVFNGVVYMQDAAKFLPLMENIVKEFNERRLFFEKICGAMLTQLLSQLARVNSVGFKTSTQKKADIIISYIKEHYCEKITNKTIGEHFNYHPNYINRLIVNYTGMSLHSYLLTYRINTAIHLLQSGEMTVSEVASAVGFCDAMHFSKYFKQKTGKSPSSYTTVSR